MRIFIKIFFVFSLFFLSLSFKSSAEVVNKVEIQGNERITKETIIIYGDIKIGSDYETSDLNLLIKKLYETTFFSNISAELDNGLLNIQVEENPIVNSITFEGEKTKKFKEALTKLLLIREKGSFIKGYVKSDINLIKEFYRQQGFYFIKIDLQVENLESNRVNLVYFLEKGEKAKEVTLI